MLLWLFAAAALGAILALTLQSAQGTTALSDWFRDVLLRFVPEGSPAARWISANVRRLGHLPEYFLLGFTVYTALRGTFPEKRMALWAVVICGGVSLGDQLLKELIPVRHFDIWDLPVDLIGYGVGAGFAACICKKWERRKGREYDKEKADCD